MAKTKVQSEGVCSRCGKPLSRHTSVQQGMGDTCLEKTMGAKARGFDSLDALKASMEVEKLPSDLWIPLKGAIEMAKKKHGYTTYAFLKLIGGNRMVDKPFTREFKVVYFKGQRYISKQCLNFLPPMGQNDARKSRKPSKKQPAKTAEKAPKKRSLFTRKPKPTTGPSGYIEDL